MLNFLRCCERAQDLRHVCGMADGAAARERRIAVVELRQRAYAALGHLILVAYEHTVDIAHAERPNTRR